MRKLIQLFTFLSVTIAMNVSYTSAQQSEISIPLNKIEGRWFIHYSDFPMWTKGDKQFPTFNYKIIPKKSEKKLLDVVEYTKNGKSKTIKGDDKVLNTENTKFKWRGKGFLWFFVSKWEIVYFNEKDNWAIIKFEKTLFTPAGFDVITKSQTLSDEQKQEIESKLEELDLLVQLSRIPQN